MQLGTLVPKLNLLQFEVICGAQQHIRSWLGVWGGFGGQHNGIKQADILPLSSSSFRSSPPPPPPAPPRSALGPQVGFAAQFCSAAAHPQAVPSTQARGSGQGSIVLQCVLFISVLLWCIVLGIPFYDM